MSRDLFDQFRRMEMLIQNLLEARSTKRTFRGGVFIRKSDGKTRIDIRGNVPDSTIRALKQKYPNAEISIEAEEKRTSRLPLTTIERTEKFEEGKKRSEETSSRELALKRFREKKREREREDPASKEGEDG